MLHFSLFCFANFVKFYFRDYYLMCIFSQLSKYKGWLCDTPLKRSFHDSVLRQARKNIKDIIIVLIFYCKSIKNVYCFLVRASNFHRITLQLFTLSLIQLFTFPDQDHRRVLALLIYDYEIFISKILFSDTPTSYQATDWKKIFLGSRHYFIVENWYSRKKSDLCARPGYFLEDGRIV